MEEAMQPMGRARISKSAIAPRAVAEIWQHKNFDKGRAGCEIFHLIAAGGIYPADMVAGVIPVTWGW